LKFEFFTLSLHPAVKIHSVATVLAFFNHIFETNNLRVFFNYGLFWRLRFGNIIRRLAVRVSFSCLDISLCLLFHFHIKLGRFFFCFGLLVRDNLGVAILIEGWNAARKLSFSNQTYRRSFVLLLFHVIECFLSSQIKNVIHFEFFC
jgi:hypothetical protein